MKDFDGWYKDNKNYYVIKHMGTEDEMERDAMRAYHEMLVFAARPPPQVEKRKSKKPNPYGFDL